MASFDIIPLWKPTENQLLCPTPAAKSAWFCNGPKPTTGFIARIRVKVILTFTSRSQSSEEKCNLKNAENLQNYNQENGWLNIEPFS